MRCIFITHIHGDHQLGVLKMMLERDILLPKKEEGID
jgi:ribonuclease BN (tRNA processing enzyme)